MQTDKSVRPLGSTSDFRDRQGRRVACKNRRRRTERIQRPKKFSLRRELLDDRLDDDVAILEVFDLGGALEPSADFILRRFRDGALLGQPIQVLVDALKPLVQ